MKKTIIGLLLSFLSAVVISLPVFANPPTFEQNFIKPLTQTNQEQYGNETLRDRTQLGIDKNKSIQDNIKALFYPDAGQGGKLRDIIKVIGLIVFVLCIVRQGFQYILQADDESKVTGYHINIAYIFLGALIFFSTIWILSLGLNIDQGGGTVALLNRLDNGVIFQIFGGLRAGAFFAAIILLMYYGYRMILSMEDEEKLKTMRQGVLNVIYALVLIKIIDYIYFIAQTPNFKSKATELIIEVSKVLGYILGAFFTLSIIFYGFKLMFSNGDDAALTKVKDVITGVLLGTLVLFIFFLIVYQVVQEFAV